MSDGTTNQFRCDAAARIATSTQTTDGVSYPFTYAYYMDGNVASVQYPSGRTVSYPSVDRAGRVTQVTGTLGGASKSYVSAMTYNEQGLMAATALGNGLTERWSYNAQRLQPSDVRLGTAVNEISHFALKFAYCASNDSGGSCAANNGNIVAQWNYTNNHIEQYGYDAVNRLASAADYAAPNGWSQSYGYDRFGNRWVSANGTLPMDPRTPDSQSDINAANNRLTGANYAYDAAGNQTKYGGWTLGYDAENQLVSSQPSGGSVTTYAYDGDGRRVKKTTGGVSTVYVYDADGELAAEYGGAAQTAETHYITTDHLGSTRLVTDASGNVISRHDYLPFGEEIPAGVGGRTAAMGYVANNSLTQRFTGKERDTETGLDYFGARYFSDAQGRFASPDAAGPDLTNPQTFNKYRYALNDPLRYVDRNGLYEEDVHLNLTYALALATGIWSKTAERIAQGDQGVDDNPATSPMGMMPCCGPEQVRADYHFTSPERRSQLYEAFERSHMAEDLGVFLHAEQDSFSHAGYGAAWGHARDGHTPDKTYSDPAKADRMAKDTFDILMGASSQFTRSGPAVSWKAISPYVQRFNRAGEKDKRKAFSDLVNAVWRARSEEMRREADRMRTGACSAEFSSCEGH